VSYRIPEQHAGKLGLVILKACALVFAYGYGLALVCWLVTGENPWRG
jgi:hypothetical protein